MADISNTSYGGPDNGSHEITPGKEDTLPKPPPAFISQNSNTSHISVSPQPSVSSSETLGTLNPNQLTANTQAKIPPLMGIQTNVTVLTTDPNPPTVSNPTSAPQTEVSAPPSSMTTVAGSGDILSVTSTSAPAADTNSSSSPATVSLGKPRMSQGKVMDGSYSQASYSTEEAENDDGGIQKKVPILRLKKKLLTQDDDDATFERQEVSKNDSYCWVCHDGGDVLCCDKCPRVFHIQCSGLPKEPEEDKEWFCSVCKSIARKTKRSQPPNLKELLLLAVGRMMFPGTELFQAPVPADIMVHYREYVFHPLDLGTMKKKVINGEYQSTREFTHDAEWILHNCTIYNGGKHALTKIAKGIIKVCKEDMREIELCSGCYKLSVRQPKDWFSVPCTPPHPVVLAKVRGYPLWPAKLISRTSDKCDVRFFGQHDRSLVPKSSITELVGNPPKPSTKTQHWNIAMFELKKYRENIDEIQAQRNGGKLPGKPIRLTKQQDPKIPSGELNHHGNSLANHLPSSPAVVEVSPSGLHGNSSHAGSAPPTLSEPSSPDSPPKLQIDLEDSTQGKQFQSPNKLGMLNVIERNSQVAGSLDSSAATGPQTVTNMTVSSPTSTLSKFKKGIKGRKAGDTLSQLVSNLAERRGLGVVTTGSSTPVVVTSGGVPMSLDAPEGEQSSKDTETEESGGTQTTTMVDVNPAFSSVYADRNKTAIYEVDPNGKRDRKRKKLSNDITPPQTKKAARTKSPNKAAPLNDSILESPQIHVATSEVVKLSHMAVDDRVPSSVSPQPPMIVPGSNGQTQITTNTQSGSSIIVGPKTPSKPKKRRPKNSKTSKTSLTIKPGTLAPSITPSPALATHAGPVVSSAVIQQTPSLTTESEEQRGEEAALGARGGATGMDDFQEGNGLLADTLRKVDRSFHARLNQMAGGGSEDMGYQYFMEKLMSSVKAVLIEMLSTFDAKSRLGAKQLKDQLHTCWPVPNSRVALDQLRKELRDEMKQSLEVVRASAALELEQVVNEVKRQVEKEKEIAINETKKMRWCSYCLNEAHFNCCWNANYCNEVCQQAHWPEHQKECTQVQQQPTPRTPGLTQSEFHLATPTSKPTTPQLPAPSHNLTSSMAAVNNAASQESTPQQQQQPGGYMFMNSSAAAMAAAVQAHAQAQRHGQSMMTGVAGGNPALTQQVIPTAQSGPASVGGPHSQQQRLSQESSHPHTSHPHTSHSHNPSTIVDGMVGSHNVEHTTSLENSTSRIEHLPSENILITTAAASPPHHIRSLFLSQNQQQMQQQQQRVNTESPGLSSLGTHQGPATPASALHHGMASTPIAVAENPSINSGNHPGQHQSSDHSHSSNSSILLHSQSPISPAIAHSEAQPAVHNYSWPYQQQLLIGHGSENYRHLIPAMQVNTSSSQNTPFFRAAY